jgi:hypothetical protein
MANPASLTINDLAANSAISLPTAQAIDTNGTVPIDAKGQTDLLIIEVVNTDDAALTVAVKAGDNPPAQRAGLGDLSVALAASGGGATASRMIGPFESARFAQDDGKVNVTFTAATGAPAASVRVYRLPRKV